MCGSWVDLLRSYEGDVATLRANHPLVADHHVRVARTYAERFPEEIEPFVGERPSQADWRNATVVIDRSLAAVTMGRAQARREVEPELSRQNYPCALSVSRALRSCARISPVGFLFVCTFT
jgi:hypothetical protein